MVAKSLFGSLFQNLDNIDDLINCMGGLEAEDVIYLEEYLIRESSSDSLSPSNWSLTQSDPDINLSKFTTGNTTEDNSSLAVQLPVPVEENNPDDPPEPPDLHR